MLKKFLVGFVFIIASSMVFAEWDQAYFRGTPNNWGVTSMEKIGHGTWKIVVRFEDGDNNGGPRFKISKYNNWDKSYPDKDYKVDGNSTYEIIFKDKTKEIFVKKDMVMMTDMKMEINISMVMTMIMIMTITGTKHISEGLQTDGAAVKWRKPENIYG